MTDEDAGADEYPPGPITCCIRGISKKIRVRDDNTWTVSLIIAWTSSFTSTILFLVAFGTASWAKAESAAADGTVITRSVGLWQECHSDTGCAYVTSDTNIGASFKVCQTFSVLILLLLLAGVTLTITYTFVPGITVHSRLGLWAMWCRLLSLILLLTLVPVFAKKWPDPKYGSSDYTTSLGYSFKLAVVALCLEAIGALFMYCDVVVFEEEKPKQEQHNQIRAVSHYEGLANESFNENGIHPGSGFVHSDYQKLPSSTLQARVQGHMNAKRAFENFAFDQIDAKSNHTTANFRASTESLFKSKENIARRFTGITLAEPEYTSMCGNQDQRINREVNQPHKKHMYESRNSLTPSTNYSVSDRHPKGNTGRWQSDINQGQMLRKDAHGRLITSVSMYDIHDEISLDNGYGTGDNLDTASAATWRSYQRSHRPYDQRSELSRQNQSNYTEHTNRERTVGPHKQSPGVHRETNRNQTNNQQHPNRSRQSQSGGYIGTGGPAGRGNNGDKKEHSYANTSKYRQGESEPYHRSSHEQPRVPRADKNSRQQDIGPVSDNRSSHQVNRDPKSDNRSHQSVRESRSDNKSDQPDRDQRSDNRSHPPVRDARSDSRSHQSVRDPRSDNRSHQAIKDSRSDSRSHQSDRDPRSDNRSHLSVRDPGSDDRSHQSVRDPRFDNRSHQAIRDPRSDNRSHQSVRDPRSDSRSHQSDRDPRSDNRSHLSVRDPRSDNRSSHQPVGDPRSDNRSQQSVSDPRSQNRSSHQQNPGRRQREHDNKAHVQQNEDETLRNHDTLSQSMLIQNNQTPSGHSQRHTGQGNMQNSRPIAPARKIRNRNKSNENSGNAPLTRAQSTLSLQSVASNATTIVAGCSESEI